MQRGGWGWLAALVACGTEPTPSTPEPVEPGALLTQVWTGEPDQAFAGYGAWVAPAGDVDGDGFADVAVGAVYHDGNSLDEGRAYVYHGSADGLVPTPAWTSDGGQDVAWYGRVVAGAGDVDADGYDDLVVGAPRFDANAVDEGRAYLYLGSAAGLASEPVWTFDSGQTEASLGIWVAGAGDVNGDGFADVLVAASHADGGQANEGRALLFLGSAAGLGDAPVWSAESDQAQSYFGAATSAAGDVDGDGLGDVVVGAPLFDGALRDEGRVELYLGEPAGLPSEPAWAVESGQADAYLGVSAASAGDVDGDGLGDVLVGAPDYEDGELGEGHVWVYRGTATGLEDGPLSVAQPDRESADFGSTAASGGDVDGDGHSEVFVGGGQYDRVYLYRGGPAGLDATPMWIGQADAGDFPEGATVPVERDLEYSVASAGDVDGNGFDDLIFGAAYASHGEEQEGRAYVYLANRAR